MALLRSLDYRENAVCYKQAAPTELLVHLCATSRGARSWWHRAYAGAMAMANHALLVVDNYSKKADVLQCAHEAIQGLIKERSEIVQRVSKRLKA